MIDASIRKRTGRCRIRPFSLADLDSALKIEADSFTFPWTKDMFLSELGRDVISRCFVAEVIYGTGDEMNPAPDMASMAQDGNVLAGYIMSWLVADELYITNLAVSPDHRRSGLAARLIEHAMDDARKEGAVWCQLEVRVSNAAALALYGKYGFREIGIRKGYYQDGEDALVLGLDLSKSWS